MRNVIVLTPLAATLLGWIAMETVFETAAEPPPAPHWVRTADGWEPATWAVKRPSVKFNETPHPGIVSLLLLGGSLAGLVGSQRGSLEPNKNEVALGPCDRL